LCCGCGGNTKEEPPKPSTRVMLRSTDARLSRATVVLDGARQGMAGRDEFWASFELPRNLPAGPPAVVVEIPTPCGPQSAPVEVLMDIDEPQRPGMPYVRKEARLRLAEATAPKALQEHAVPVLVDSDQPVKLGKISLERGKHFVSGLACAPSHDVTIADKVVGKVDSAIGDREAVFISGDPAACYLFEHVAYGGGTSSKTELRGNQVYKTQTPDWFLVVPPATLEVDSKSGRNDLTALNKAPCAAP
jgi:hypothetical protein